MKTVYSRLSAFCAINRFIAGRQRHTIDFLWYVYRKCMDIWEKSIVNVERKLYDIYTKIFFLCHLKLLNFWKILEILLKSHFSNYLYLRSTSFLCFFYSVLLHYCNIVSKKSIWKRLRSAQSQFSKRSSIIRDKLI